jgi:hypothetical protein
MKRLLVPILLLALCSPVTAGLFITVDGVVDPPEVNMLFGEHAVIGIWGDGETEPYVFFLGVAAGDPGTLDIANAVTFPPGPWPPVRPCIWWWWDDCEIAEILGLNCPVIFIELTDGSPDPPPLNGQLVDLISFHCEGLGDVTLMLFNADGELMDTQLIHQGDEPPALEILEPNGGEYYRAGTGQEIRFVDNRTPGEYLPNYQRRLSVNNGQTWMFWIGGPPPNCEAGECSWQWYVPGMDWGNCLVRIFDANDPEADDTSDASFTIYTGRLFVDADDGNDTNNGISPETAFATIQKAIDIANDGDTITVAPGTYAENIKFLGKNITLTSTGPSNSNTVKSTIINGSVTFRGTEEVNCTLTGFNISGPITGYDAMIDPGGENHTHAAISYCILENIATGCGGVIQGCDGIISNCLIANISYTCESPSPVPQIVGCHGLIENCTMANIHDGIEFLPGGTSTLRNCILYRSSPIIVPAEATLNISYCNIENDPGIIVGDGTVNWGPGNIEGDPCFADEGSFPTAGDYHLKSQAGRYDPNTQSWAIDDVTSLCIDAGDPMTPINFEPFSNGGIVNIGAYGGTPEAGKSYFGKPPCTTIIAGDVNGDCIVNFKDAVIMFSHWLEGSMP